MSAGPASLAGRGWGRCCPGLSPLCTAAALLSRGCWCPTCGDPASKRGHVHRHRGRGFHVFRGTQFTAPHGVHSPPRRPCPARALCVPRVGGFGWESVRGLLLRPLQRSRFQVVSSAAVPVQAEALGERTCHFFRVSRRGRLWVTRVSRTEGRVPRRQCCSAGPLTGSSKAAEKPFSSMFGGTR